MKGRNTLLLLTESLSPSGIGLALSPKEDNTSSKNTEANNERNHKT